MHLFVVLAIQLTYLSMVATCHEGGDKDLCENDVVNRFPSEFKTHFTHDVGYDKAAGPVDGYERDPWGWWWW